MNCSSKTAVVVVFCIFILSMISSISAQTVLWTENWEGMGWTDSWEITNGTWEVGVPFSGPNAANQGSKCAGTNLAGDYNDDTYSQLIRVHEFTVPAASQNPHLRFWQWYSMSGSDWGVVQIKPEGGDWEDVSPHYGGHSSYHWYRAYLDLSAYSGQTVQLAFYFQSSSYYGSWNTSSGWYVDNIQFEIGTTDFDPNESFENGWNGWYADYGCWEIGTPTYGPSAAHDGTAVAGTILDGDYYDDTYSSLVSPKFTIDPATPVLRYWQWFNLGGNDWVVLHIIDSNGNWIEISPHYSGHCNDRWYRPYFDLSAYAGQEVQLAFYLHAATYYGTSYTSSGWYIDDIQFESLPAAMNPNESFENGWNGWYADYGCWEIGTPTYGPSAAHDGTAVAGTILDGDYYDDTYSSLISPKFTIDPATPVLRYWQWFNLGGNDWVVLHIIDSNGNWVEISPRYSGHCNDRWYRPYFDLSAYAGQEVQLAFYLHAGTYYGSWYVSSGWYIDDIQFESLPAAMNLNESFENGWNGWYADYGCWEIGTPTYGPSAAHDGTAVAGTILDGDYYDDTYSSLISPKFTIDPATPVLRYWQWFNLGGDDWVVLQIIDSNGNWVEISPRYSGHCNDRWYRPYFDLSAYAGQEVQLAFYLHAGTYYGSWYVSSGWYIDDIQFESLPAAMNPNESFENGWNGWYADYGCWEIGTPTYGPSAAHDGTAVAGTILDGNYYDDTYSSLISPKFTIDPATPVLRYWQWLNLGGDDWVVLHIIDSNGNWIEISPRYSGHCNDRWYRPYFDLSVYAGQEVQLAFYLHAATYYGTSYTSSGWYIDDIQFESLPAAMNPNESFENGWIGWYADYGCWEIGTPTYGPSAAHDGTAVAGTILDGDYYDDTYSSLISPKFTIDPATPVLRYWQWFNLGGNDWVVLQIIDSNGNWVEISPRYSGHCNDRWYRPYFDLSAYAGQEVQLAFYLHAATYYGSWYVSSGWYIDDIQFESLPAAMNPNESFENGWNGWYADYGCWEIGTPTYGPSAAHDGTAVAGTILDGDYYDDTYSSLISPNFIVDPAFPIIHYWQWYSFGGNDWGEMYIINSSGEWILIQPGFGGGCDGNWGEAFYDLSPYSGQQVQLAFYIHAGTYYGSWYTSSGWYLDDISFVNQIPIPDNLLLSVSDEQLYLSWDMVSGVWDYFIEESLSPDGPWTEVTDSGYLSLNWEIGTWQRTVDDRSQMFFRVQSIVNTNRGMNQANGLHAQHIMDTKNTSVAYPNRIVSMPQDAPGYKYRNPILEDRR